MNKLAELKSITQAELAGKLHVGQDDTPALSTLGMQQLMDAHPNANTTAINQHSTTQNANNAIVRAAIESLESHAASIINPHQVTKEQLGLGNCDNTADADKPVSEAQKAAMAAAIESQEAAMAAAIESQEATIAAMRDYIDGVVFEAGAVSSVFGRSGAVVARAGDYTADMVGAVSATEIARRERSPDLPDYGLDSDLALLTAPYSGQAEITLQVEDSLYDAQNMSARKETAPSGTIIIRKVE